MVKCLKGEGKWAASMVVRKDKAGALWGSLACEETLLVWRGAAEVEKELPSMTWWQAAWLPDQKASTSLHKSSKRQWVGQCKKERLHGSLTWPKERPRMMLGRSARRGQRNKVHCSAAQSHIDSSSLIHTHAYIIPAHLYTQLIQVSHLLHRTNMAWRVDVSHETGCC